MKKDWVLWLHTRQKFILALTGGEELRVDGSQTDSVLSFRDYVLMGWTADCCGRFYQQVGWEALLNTLVQQHWRKPRG